MGLGFLKVHAPLSIYFAPNVPAKGVLQNFKATVYTIWVHGPLGP